MVGPGAHVRAALSGEFAARNAQQRFKNVDEVTPYLRFADAPA